MSGELAYGLDPFINDSALDADGDGVTNLAEFQADYQSNDRPGQHGSRCTGY